jgi:hypothetical protein
MRGEMGQLPYGKRKVCNYGSAIKREMNKHGFKGVKAS